MKLEFKFAVLLLNLLSLSQLVLAVSDFFDISPPTVIIENSTLGNETIFVKLKSKPEDSVKIRVTGNDLLTFSTCELIFGPDDFDREQRLIVGSTTNEPRNAFSRTGISFSLDASSTSIPGSISLDESQKVVVKSRGPMSGECTSLGQSSFRTFDGQLNQLLGQGTFYFVRSNDLVVQIVLENCHEGFCVKRAALLHKKKGLAIVDLNSTNQTGNISIYGDNSTFSVQQPEKNQFQIQMDDWLVANINCGPVKADITLTVPNTYIGRTSGICGNFDGIGSTDIIESEFLETASAVPADENLFIACCFNGKEDVVSMARVIRKLNILESMERGKLENGPPIGKLQSCMNENLESARDETTQGSLTSNAVIASKMTTLPQMMGSTMLTILLLFIGM